PVARTYPGNHPKSVRSLYVTGDLPEGRPDEDETPAIEFRHTNGSQGIGFGYNTIYATGSNANQDLNLSPRGTGKVEVTAPLSVTGTITGQGAVPVGAIMMWSGDVKSLPKGWVLCDGGNETPDLRGRFIVGYSAQDVDYSAIKPGQRDTEKKTVD